MPTDSPAPNLDRLQDSPPEEDQQTTQNYQKEVDAYWADARQQDNKDRDQDRAQRKQYSSRLFWLVVGWLFAVGGILLLSGFGAWGFQLTEVVLGTLIGTTTASVLGLFTIVVRYLFPHR